MEENTQRRLSDIPVSVLDLSGVRAGETARDAFQNSLTLAQHAEKQGYTRYWFAEHHNMESIASAATSVLIGYVAGGTSTIRVGSGGVMLPNHAPLIIAEQFGTLESLYPGRIDLGLGRAPGTDQLTAYALRRNLNASVDDFPKDVIELRNYFKPELPNPKVRAFPGGGLHVPIWLLGSSTFSAQLAGILGMPFAFASHFAPTHLHAALRIYRDSFKPSEYLQQPYAMACVNVIAADTDAEANYLATSFYQLAIGIVRGTTKPIQPPVESMEGIWSDYEKAVVHNMMQYAFIGSKETVSNGLQQFLDETGVDELMVVSHLYDLQSKLHSYHLISDLFKKSIEPTYSRV